MSVLLLTRHGQASAGKRNYDALSKVGHQQADLLGRTWAERGTVPDVIVRGELVRHRQTAEGIVAGLGVEVPVTVDAGWDEFDFGHVVGVHKPLYKNRALMVADLVRAGKGRPGAAYQQVFEAATARWVSGEFDDEYEESFPAFVERIEGALHRTALNNSGTVAVVTSGGPIAVATSLALAGDSSLWAPLNRVSVNTAVTKMLSGSRGLSLSTYNEHAHLEHDRLLTYR